MTQRLRPPQAYPATTSLSITSASTPPIDLRNLHYRLVKKLGFQIGTTQFGIIKNTNSTNRTLLVSDAIYAEAVAKGVDFSDMLYNSNVAEAPELAASDVPPFAQFGLYPQVCVALGDSLTDSTTGSTSYALLNDRTQALGLLGAASSGLPMGFATDNGSLMPYRAFTYSWTNPRSRIVFNSGHPGWRCTNIPGYVYSTGSPHLDNIERFTNLPISPNQQLVFYIFLGTNDIAYASQNNNAGLASVPTGTPGFTSTGSPNYFTDSLIPLITAIKVKYPTAKIIWQSPACRSNGPLNTNYAELPAYAIANRAALGIDLIVDTRQIPQFDPRNTAASFDYRYYQRDNVHLTPLGYSLHRPYREAAYDFLLGFPIPAPISSAFYYS